VTAQLLNFGAVIRVSSESNNLFQVQQKTLMGARFDYKESKDLLLGGTMMYLTERPLKAPESKHWREADFELGCRIGWNLQKRVRGFLTKMVGIGFLLLKPKSHQTLLYLVNMLELVPRYSKLTCAEWHEPTLMDFEASGNTF
jgi:hypothetical protein